MDFAILNIALFELFLVILIFIFTLVIPIYLTMDLFKHEVTSNQLILCLVLIWILPTFGSLIYYFLLRPDYPLKKELN